MPPGIRKKLPLILPLHCAFLPLVYLFSVGSPGQFVGFQLPERVRLPHFLFPHFLILAPLNESAANSLRKVFEELLILHRLKVSLRDSEKPCTRRSGITRAI